jgi:hypothetical protein
MSTILRVGPYRFFFYSNENGEPAHIHVERDSSTAKFWLEPVSLADNYGFSSKQLREIHEIVVSNRFFLLQSFVEFHGGEV